MVRINQEPAADDSLEKMADRMDALIVQTFADPRTKHYLADVLMLMALMRIGQMHGGDELTLASRIAATYGNLVQKEWYA